jgi:hypothetical protein
MKAPLQVLPMARRGPEDYYSYPTAAATTVQTPIPNNFVHSTSTTVILTHDDVATKIYNSNGSEGLDVPTSNFFHRHFLQSIEE